MENNSNKLTLKKKRKKEKGGVVDVDKVDQLRHDDEDSSYELKSSCMPNSILEKKLSQSVNESEIDDFPKTTGASNIKSNKFKKNGKGKKKDHLVSKKERKLMEKNRDVQVEGFHHITSMDEDCSEGMKEEQSSKQDSKNEKKGHRKGRKKEKGSVAVLDKVEQLSYVDEDGSNEPKYKLKKNGKRIKKDHLVSKKERKFVEEKNDVEVEKVYHITSVDEDCSKGMKKWLIEYHRNRPGLKVLQQRIDEFIIAHEVQEEQARKERESRAAEGGWTVVVHHKGRKKTTDSESGITVGSVAQAAVEDKMAKKKSKEVPLNFYRFQRREAQRNEVMMLQSKFEQDKKRIQQLRAARKFRPY